MPSIIHSGNNNNSPNIINQLLSAIQAAITDIKMFYDNLSAGWSGTFTDGSGQTVTVVSGLVISVEAPLLPLRLTWDAIGNALYTTVGDYNTLFGSDFTTLTVDGNDQLLTGNSTTFAMPTSVFNGNVSIVAINDEAESVTSLGQAVISGCTSLTIITFPACTSIIEVGVSGCTALTTAVFNACTSVGLEAFNNCTSLTTVILPLCGDLGGSIDDNSVFGGISGNTITLTIAASRETCDGGNPDGDIVYLAANNTATINYV